MEMKMFQASFENKKRERTRDDTDTDTNLSAGYRFNK